MENAQTGLPSWAAALAEQLHASFAAQMSRIRAEHEGVPRERTLAARVARAQSQDLQNEIVALLLSQRR